MSGRIASVTSVMLFGAYSSRKLVEPLTEQYDLAMEAEAPGSTA
jgi:hypothetical protein